MPGLLRAGAMCPKCGNALIALSDVSLPHGAGVVRELFHKRMPGAIRRRRKCLQVFVSVDRAAHERRALEVVS